MTDHAPLTDRRAPAVATQVQQHDTTARSGPAHLVHLQSALDQRPAIVMQRQWRAALSRPLEADRSPGATGIVQRMYNGVDDPVAGQAGGQEGAQPGAQQGEQGQHANADGVDNWADFDAFFGNQAAQQGGADGVEFGAFQGPGNVADGQNDGQNDGDFDFDAAFDNLHGDHAPPPAPALAGMGPHVGIGAHETSDGPMYTDQLYNCIAVVGLNPATHLACLYHWNTGGGAFENDDDHDSEDEDGNAQIHLRPNPNGIAAAKGVVDGGAPGATVYHLVFGRSWGDGMMDHHRPAFEETLRAAFGNINIAAEAHGSARWADATLTGFG